MNDIQEMDERKKFIGPYMPPEGRPAAEKMMAVSIEDQIDWRKARHMDDIMISRGAMEEQLDPRICNNEFLNSLKTPDGNRQAIEVNSK